MFKQIGDFMENYFFKISMWLQERLQHAAMSYCFDRKMEICY